MNSSKVERYKHNHQSVFFDIDALVERIGKKIRANDYLDAGDYENEFHSKLYNGLNTTRRNLQVIQSLIDGDYDGDLENIEFYSPDTP